MNTAPAPSQPTPPTAPKGAQDQPAEAAAPAAAHPAGRALALGLPLGLVAGAALGEAVAWLAGGAPRGLGAAAGALAAGVVGGAAAAWAWRLRAPSPVPASAAVPAAVEPAGSATRDPLTGAFTQRHFVAAADREWARIRRHNEDAALLMVDADDFRTLNDKHGPACGDAMLVEITRQVSATLRQYDLLARFGGGVLVVYLPHTDPIGALDVAERLRERVAGFRLRWEGQTVGATVSVGVASIGPDHAALDAVISDAGAALREAKAAGRNCVRAAPVQPRRTTAAGPSVGGHRAAGKA